MERNKMKKLISLMLILCMACMLIPAMAEEESPAGVWYGDYSGAVMILTLGEDGSASMEVSGNVMGTGTWAVVDGKIEITMNDMSGEPSTVVATLADGVLTMADDTMSVDFTREPIEAWAPAEVKADAAAEDFDGEWVVAKVSMMGMMLDAASIGMGDVGVKIENCTVVFSGSSESITFFTGTDPIELPYENGALVYSVDIPNDAEPLTFTMKAELLQDGMLAVTIDMGTAMALYFTKAAE